MLAGAAGQSFPSFLHWSENITGFTAFGLAAAGMIIGSLLGRKRTVSSQEPVAAD
jgi:hypothetical protein